MIIIYSFNINVCKSMNIKLKYASLFYLLSRRIYINFYRTYNNLLSNYYRVILNSRYIYINSSYKSLFCILYIVFLIIHEFCISKNYMYCNIYCNQNILINNIHCNAIISNSNPNTFSSDTSYTLLCSSYKFSYHIKSILFLIQYNLYNIQLCKMYILINTFDKFFLYKFCINILILNIFCTLIYRIIYT